MHLRWTQDHLPFLACCVILGLTSHGLPEISFSGRLPMLKGETA